MVILIWLYQQGNIHPAAYREEFIFYSRGSGIVTTTSATTATNAVVSTGEANSTLGMSTIKLI